MKDKRVLLLMLILACVAGSLWAYRAGMLAPEVIMRFLRDYPVLAPVFFMLLYAFMVLTLLPTLPLNLGAGFLWGPWWGWVYSMVGAMMGAAAAFTIARYIASDYLHTRFNNRAWRWLQSEIASSGWKAVAFSRINPLFPFGPVNFFFGTTSISFAKFFWSTAGFIALPALAISFIGSSFGILADRAETYSTLHDLFMISGLVTLVICAQFVLKRLIFKSKQTQVLKIEEE